MEPEAERKSAAYHLQGQFLPGERSDRVWEVIEQCELDPDKTPGEFSVGYLVKDQDGRDAFMKVSDLGLLTHEGEGLFERMHAAFMKHNAEKSILEKCRGNNMDRIVVALDHGTFKAEIEGEMEAILFLIFEHAQGGDLRVQVDKALRYKTDWCLNVLHDLAVGIKQLHTGKISHNDIKPANMLVFTETLQKLADLGAATSVDLRTPYEQLLRLGDVRYAAPECLYQLSDDQREDARKFENRRLSDLYHLAGMTCFMFTGKNLTPAVLEKMREEHRPPLTDVAGGWTGSFDDILPYWRSAFNEVVEDFSEQIAEGFTLDEKAQTILVRIVKELGEPDPALRGHPQNRVAHADRRSVEKYISALDLSRKRHRVLA